MEGQDMTTHKLEEAMKKLTPETIMGFEIEYDQYESFIYLSDQMNVNYPVRFPVVQVKIISEKVLSEIADEVMHREGYGGMWDEDCDDVWYDFYMSFYQIEKDGEIKAENRVEFEPNNHPEAPEYPRFQIELTEENQAAIVKWFTDVAVPYMRDATAVDVFNEARNEMLEWYYETKDLI